MGSAILYIYLYYFGWYYQQASVFYVLYEKGYEQGIYLCDNLAFRVEIALKYFSVFFAMVILRKGGSEKASLYYFALFYTL